MHNELNINDHRAQLLKQLYEYVPLSDEEREHQKRVITFVQQDENCFSRSNFYGHITGSAWIVNETGNEVLLTLHRKIGLWLQLGGHAEGETDVMKVALREAQEESGVDDVIALQEGIFDVDVHTVPAFRSEPAHFHFDVRYLFLIHSSSLLEMSDESLDLHWMDIEYVERLNTDHSVRRMAQKWLDLKATA